MRRKLTKADFMERFVLDGQTDCWLWTGPKINSGYGTFGSHKLAHRASYELFNGPIPDGLEILHGCDVKLCVNPKHLEVGTRVDNMQDAKQKGRNAHGSGHGRSKLTEEEVIEVLQSPLVQAEIAKIFGIGQTQVSRIKAGKRWAHLKGN